MTLRAGSAKLAIVLARLRAVLGAFRPKASLALENLALRQQLAVLRGAAPRPRLRSVDRGFWAAHSAYGCAVTLMCENAAPVERQDEFFATTGSPVYA